MLFAYHSENILAKKAGEEQKKELDKPVPFAWCGREDLNFHDQKRSQDP
ncbi:hypothetical protein LDBUL1519_01612 [Lactobacillus delbrueckii subsp. bulgaricus CNCM I-1519]|nr:hypothetical protein LDBUL1519_01612 [Lactobacillus delbrueckii subsp. bulgaricus CNCM I-1519]